MDRGRSGKAHNDSRVAFEFDMPIGDFPNQQFFTTVPPLSVTQPVIFDVTSPKAVSSRSG